MASLGQSLFRLAEAALKSIASRPASKPVPPGTYAPQPGNTADPGEIVWTWVPYEDDPNQGKDRPVLIIGRDGGSLLALMLTSRDRNNAKSRHDGYVDIGSGSWDRRGRPSEVYLERLLTIDPEAVRRIGSTLDRPLFDRVLSRYRRLS
ncbi:hypothetical protein GCM10027404_31290 [Arthrobacter tumbae]|uniref:type II toxin-antitoxin system PemK/MazF family toxin n=1 Tax=Arthrobacter tumbae TaxID=163874 RepID=UPI00195B629A|nr:type II toxin-antitoxin system PemK/MazF family toxin [Arthrobacter tumbae]MBM7783182.1 hypothetical protein [Arthrobacter tumbae]